ncbi:dipeptidase [Gemmatimonas sp.]|uniref:dipeptidase n=1 Tax=Gemmatimonas sp. TaxID=1962908 RepID=UPI00286B0F84|nr:dipeptidase [Gemmatimonas sp.]
MPMAATAQVAAKKPAAATAVSMQDASLEARIAYVRKLLRNTPLVDGHNDLPWAMREAAKDPLDVVAYDLRRKTAGMTDIARLRKGMVGGQFWSVYIPGEVRDSGYARIQLEQIDIAKRTIARYPDVFVPAFTAADVRKAYAQGKIGSLLGMEGGHAIENSLGALRSYYELGARYMTLTHNVTLDWADAANDVPRNNGLTAFGKEVVREMNRLGMMVDLAHTSPAVMSQALSVSEAPVIWSHAAARGVTDVPRNVPDSILARLPKNGGVVMMTFVPGFVSQSVANYGAQVTAIRDSLIKRFPNDNDSQFKAFAPWRQAHPTPIATISDVADHLDHIKKIAGAAHVGIGGDFDGITETVQGLEDVSTYPTLFAELLKRGWTDAELKGLAGENVLRALKGAESVSALLRKTRPASTKTIQQLDGRRK